MQKDLIEQRGWMTQSQFNASFSLIKAMPGPVAFQTAVFLGRIRAGFLGGLLAAIGLVFPAFTLMILFSLFFSSIGEFSFTHKILIGMQVAALGVILGSLKGLIGNNLRNLQFWILVIISGLINYYHPSLEPMIIVLFGLMTIFIKKLIQNRQMQLLSFAPLLLAQNLKDLGFVCFKAGALVFGTGLAIVPMLQHDVVVKYQWLNQSEFLDALAFGQMTPGPVVITATYIGHKVAGMSGAIVATLAIFSAAFFHMSTWFPYVVQKISGKKWISDFTFGAVAAVVGPIIVTVYKMSMAMNLNGILVAMSLASFVITILNLVPLWLLIPAGGIFHLVLANYFY